MFTGAIGLTLLTVIIGFWNYIKGFLIQLSGRLIAQIDVDFPLGNAIVPYARHKFVQSRFSPQHFYSIFEFVRPLRKTQLIAGEIYSSKGNIFWNGYFPIWISYGNNKDLGQVTLNITFLRGTLNPEKFLIEVLDFFNNNILESEKNRFNINHIFGTDGKPGKLLGGDLAETNRNTEYQTIKCSKLLKWSKEQIGKEIDNTKSEIDKLSLNKEATFLTYEVKRWQNNKDWFYNRGTPWKMGAALYGLPGTGKSALISAIGKDLDMPIFIYNLATLYDDELFNEWKRMLAQSPCIAVFEDFDTIFNERKNISGGHLTLDAVLNVIDGIDRANGLLIFLTTNHIENIDPALIRAGRIDRVIEMKKVDYDGRLKMSNRILSDYSDIAIELADKYSDVTGAEFQLICERKALELYHSNQEIDKLLEEANI